MKLSRPAGALLGSALLGLGAVAAVSSTGSRLRHRRNPALDELGLPDGSVAHHRIPTRDGGELHATDVGAGRPVVLMHGVTLQWWVWDALMAVLSDRFRVIAWDMRGHGESSAGSQGVTFDAIADDLDTLLSDLDLRDAILVGHSMGGMTIGHFVGRHPQALSERVGALCFVATSSSIVSATLSLGSLRTLYGISGAVLVNGLRSRLPRYRFADNDLSAVLVAAAFGSGATAPMIEAVRQMSAEMSPQSAVQAGRALAHFDATDALRTVNLPAAVVAGDLDRLAPEGHSRRIAELVRGSTLTVLADIGHQIMQEAPHELAGVIDELAAR